MPKKRRRSQATVEAPSNEDADRPHTRGVWSGTIGFGLVSIPVQLLPAARPRAIALRLLGPGGAPVGKRYYEPETGKELGDDELVRGYELSKDELVVVEDEELQKIASDKSHDIELERFVRESEMDPMYFERAYFLVPTGSSNKAYRLLAETMEATHRVGLATFVMREKEYPIAVLAENGILRAEILRFAEEVRRPEQIGLPHAEEPDKTAVKRFTSEIRRRTSRKLDMAKLKDSQAARLVEVAQTKMKHGDGFVRVEEPREPETDNLIDLMAALKKSLGGSRKGTGRTHAENRENA